MYIKNGRKGSTILADSRYFSKNFVYANAGKLSLGQNYRLLNHVAHCFLSFGNEEILTGNFIGDFVKGNDWQHYAPEIARGVLLHRSIDAFTDAHETTDRSVARIRPFARRYSGPVTDILYDHLLGIHWEKYAGEPFSDFAEKTYAMLLRRRADMPAVLQERLPRMLEHDFLRGYTRRDGMYLVMDRFSRRLPPDIDMRALLDYFFENIDAFSEDFNVFFPDLLAHVKQQLSI